MSTGEQGGVGRPEADSELVAIADYVTNTAIDSDEAYRTARFDLMDSLACAMLALDYPACTKLLGPVVPGAEMAAGVPVPGTSYRLEPVQAAWNIGATIRWLDFNDTWLAAEWGHPSDNVAAILAAADYRSRRAAATGDASPTMGDVLTAMIKAHEIQGVIALENAFNRLGLDHVLLVRLASACVVTSLLGGSQQAVVDSASHAWLDGGALRAYRHAPQAGPRKSWAAGDAAARGVQLALLVGRGELGYPAALSAPTWGFQDALMGGQRLARSQGFGSYAMENVLFKISYPAEFHAQTAVEAAVALYPQVTGRVDAIERVAIETQEAGNRIINKAGPLHNPADRDHCLQYMVAIALLYGELNAGHYEDAVAGDPRIDALRSRIVVSENPRFSEEYLDPDKRAIGNAVQVFFQDGTATERVSIDYPLGHRRRRQEGLPALISKFENALAGRFASAQLARIQAACEDPRAFHAMPVHEFMDLWAIPGQAQ